MIGNLLSSPTNLLAARRAPLDAAHRLTARSRHAPRYSRTMNSLRKPYPADVGDEDRVFVAL
jgi:hypothetical protein